MNKDADKDDAAVATTFDAFAAKAMTDSWFAALGEPLTPAETGAAENYLTGLGLSGSEIAQAATWRDAERIANDPDWNPAWWEAEETQRKILFADAAETIPEPRLLDALTGVMNRVGGPIMGAASAAAARAGIADQALARVAAGAATQAAYQAALARVAGAGDDHPFALKYRLYAAGHWPLSVNQGKFWIL